MKLRTKRVVEFRLPAQVEYEVEFDTETGTAEILGPGHVKSFADGISRRRLQTRTDWQNEDMAVFRTLLEEDKIPLFKDGEEVMLSENRYVFRAHKWAESVGKAAGGVDRPEVFEQLEKFVLEGEELSEEVRKLCVPQGVRAVLDALEPVED